MQDASPIMGDDEGAVYRGDDRIPAYQEPIGGDHQQRSRNLNDFPEKRGRSPLQSERSSELNGFTGLSRQALDKKAGCCL